MSKINEVVTIGEHRLMYLELVADQSPRISLSKNGYIQMVIEGPHKQFMDSKRRLVDWYAENVGKEFLSDGAFVDHIMRGA